MKLKLSIYAAGLAAVTMLVTSCIKDEFDPLQSGQGQNLVKILEAPEKTFYFTPFNDVKTLDAFSLRKDANSNASLQTATTVTLSASPALIEKFNDDNGEEFELLPESFYTLTNTSFAKTATGYNVAFGSGDFAKEFTIKLDGSKWVDVGKKYALAFTISDAGSNNTISSGHEILAFFAIKNKYDGNYEVEATAPMVDATNAGLTGYYPLDSDLHTVGPNSVVMFCNTYLQGLQGHPIMSAGSASYYGNFAPIFTMDDAGKVVSVTNYYGQGTNASTRAARLDPSGVNKFTVNPDGSKTLEVSYIMVQAGADRTTFHEKWTYKGER